MNEEAEREGLAVLANKVIAKNTDSSLVKVIKKSNLVEAFSGEKSHNGGMALAAMFQQ